ncbi:MAG: TOMM precursor leader peptide-binding protein [Polyangia bacterium]
MTPPELERVLVWNPTLRVERVAEDVLFLLGERERFVLSGPRAIAVASLIDGRRSVGEIMHAAAAQVSEIESLYLIARLTAAGYLVDATLDLPAEQSAFWHGVGLDPEVAARALAETPVSLRALGDFAHPDWMTEALQEAGLRVAPDAAAQIVLTEDYLHPELAALNQRSLQRNTPLLLVGPVGVMPLIGPFLRPPLGPCWECLAFALRRNRPAEELVRRLRGEVASVPRARLAATERAIYGLAAVAIARALAADAAGATPVLRSQLLAWDYASLQSSVHSVVKRPQCPVCGDAGWMARQGERPITLQPTEKNFCEDGGYRRQTPRQTYQRYQHLVSPLTGAVTHLGPMPGRDTELRAVYASGYLICPRGELPRSNVFDKNCAGKGRSAEQSRISALCEAIERCSGVYQGDEARVHASHEELGSAALPSSELLHFSAAQYASRHRLSRAEPHLFVPEPLAPSTRIDWTPAWSLSRNERRYVPLAYCYAEAPAESGTAYCRPCGNGVAAGTSVEEALLQGILERCERDAAAIWWYNRLRRPAIDLHSFADPYFEALLADYARLGWSAWVLDLTHDLGIPTCVALAHHQADDRFVIGFGCHLEPRIAVQRALTELNQVFEPHGKRRAPWDLDLLPERGYLFPHPDLPPIQLDRLPRSSGADLRADIEECLRRLHAAGLEVLAVDKTRPDLDLPVMHVIIPGLRHFWPRFAPGRLYQVPVALGWLDRPLNEQELNPVPLFI